MRTRCREIFKQMTLLIDFPPYQRKSLWIVTIASQYIYRQINMNLLNKSSKPANLGEALMVVSLFHIFTLLIALIITLFTSQVCLLIKARKFHSI